MRRPSPWQLNDFVSFGGVALVMTVGALVVTLWGETDNIVAAAVLGWTVATVAWGIYGRLVWGRWQHLKQFDLMIDYGIMVARNGYLASSIELKAEVARFVSLYKPHFSDVEKALTHERLWVVFHPGIIENVGAYEKVAGFVRVRGRVLHVAYFKKLSDKYVPDPTRPVERTALAHELGHVVLGYCWNDWSQGRHHTFMKDEGLP